MKFYTYSQNNSGGGFDRDDNVGDYVIIEAESPEAADERASEMGLYFEGVDSGQDCECCGDRWSRASSYNEHDSPEIYGQEPEKALGGMREKIVIHYANGTKRTIGKGTPS